MPSASFSGGAVNCQDDHAELTLAPVRGADDGLDRRFIKSVVCMLLVHIWCSAIVSSRLSTASPGTQVFDSIDIIFSIYLHLKRQLSAEFRELSRFPLFYAPRNQRGEERVDPAGALSKLAHCINDVTSL
jgi:hypothetical protein